MKAVISTINSKYIHINNSVYIVQMYLDIDSEIFTYTLKDDEEYILKDLVSKNADYYFFSIYIWNIEWYKRILPKLRKVLPECKIIVGGPEVSYDSCYLLEYVDFIYSGEVSDSINEVFTKEKSAHIITLESNQYECHYNDYVHDISYFNNMTIGNNQLLYLETSKGCPFKCSYCMSSLENKVYNLDLEKVYQLIDFSINSEVKVIKFLDRTFNIDEQRAIKILDYITLNAKPFQSFQFEIAPELISESFLEYLKNLEVSYFRFEVGIQSVHDKTVNAVDRFHKYENYYHVLKVLCDETKIVTHFDLIAGLPYETFEKFKVSFNKTFSFLPDEYQLGILKLLNGTKIKSQVEFHMIEYNNVAPYTFIQNKYLSKDECDIINRVEDIVDRFYNSKRFNYTFKRLNDKYDNMFDLMLEFSDYIHSQNFKLIGYQLYDIYKIFYDFLLINNREIADYVIYDYICMAKNKPKKFYDSIDKKTLNKVLQNLVTPDTSLNYLYKYVIVEKLFLDEEVYVIKDLKTNKIKVEQQF